MVQQSPRYILVPYCANLRYETSNLLLPETFFNNAPEWLPPDEEEAQPQFHIITLLLCQNQIVLVHFLSPKIVFKNPVINFADRSLQNELYQMFCALFFINLSLSVV